MRKILVTGGTVFVSRYVAEYFAGRGDEVYVLNRNHHTQPSGTILIEADRHNLGDVLRQNTFDTVLDVTGIQRKMFRTCLMRWKSQNEASRIMYW